MTYSNGSSGGSDDSKHLVEAMLKFSRELGPVPRRVHMNPNYLKALKDEVPTESVETLNPFQGLLVESDPSVETWRIEYSDGSFRGPEDFEAVERG